MKALILNCSLKPSSEPSNTEELAGVVAAELDAHGLNCTQLRMADRNVLPGVKTDMGGADEWPEIHRQLRESDVLVMASPTWLGRPSSIAQRVLERMDAMISEMVGGRPAAYGKVAGVVVTGNEDGAHHVISEICGALIDIGYTIPAQAWTYWNRGPGPGSDYRQNSEGHEWSANTGKQAARNLVAVARALQQVPMQYG